MGLRLLPLFLLVAVPVAPAADPVPVAPPPRPARGLPPGIDPALADWTPRPATGPAEPWEQAIEANWVDGRFRRMDTGPFLNCTMAYPLGKGRERVYKATVVRLGEKGDAGVVFDRCTLRLAAGWTGGWLNHSDVRFGLMNTPTPAGTMAFAGPAGDPRATAPVPTAGRFRGQYVRADRVVFEYDRDGRRVWETTRLAPGRDGRPTVVVSAHSEAPVGEPADTVDPVVALTRPGPKRWGEPIVTKLERGTGDGPFAVDTLTIPTQNRFNALFFCTGLDFLPDGRVAVSTCHGDVWLVAVDETAGTCSWQRYATGLYHPLGLRVVDGKVVVLERGQLTRLHDLNADGEADFYENLCNDWHTGPGEHSYDTCLETDPEGNFYFFKTGDTDLPSGGTLIKVSKDGSKAETLCTGFRHPIGMGMSPAGILTGADQEGNWMPATRVDEYKPGGFYGDMRAHHRKDPPKTYDGPLCWIPREVDNSAGGQVWVPPGRFGPLAGLPIHLSYGRCRPFVLLRQKTAAGVTQGGVAPLDIRFLSGVCRGRFHPQDGHLYVCGLNGWQTAAKADGCLQRVRYTGKPLDVPTAMKVDGSSLRLTFGRPLEPAAATDPARYRVARWNYRWSGDYGSKRWKVSDPNAEGQDDVPVTAARLMPDGRTVELTVADLRPVMQMQVAYNLAAADRANVTGSVYLTVHSTR
ncbi:MAG: hypothetical protein K2X82_19600 [Gemmataceae bacterium]|nr:hypothetical protein [Gemmataceae bacterium]